MRGQKWEKKQIIITHNEKSYPQKTILRKKSAVWDSYFSETLYRVKLKYTLFLEPEQGTTKMVSRNRENTASKAARKWDWDPPA